MSDGKAWHDADIECKLVIKYLLLSQYSSNIYLFWINFWLNKLLNREQGSWLVSIQSQAEQTFIEGLIDDADDKNFFFGYSDTVKNWLIIAIIKIKFYS